MYFARRHLPWIGSFVLGVILLAGGAFMVTRGMETRDLIREELRAEQIKTSGDAPRPGVLVEDAETAHM